MHALLHVAVCPLNPGSTLTFLIHRISLLAADGARCACCRNPGHASLTYAVVRSWGLRVGECRKRQSSQAFQDEVRFSFFTSLGTAVEGKSYLKGKC